MLHPAWLTVNRTHFAENVRLTQSLIGSSQLCAVMKADAYGLGIDNLLPTIIEQQVPYVAIADNQELFAIRHHQTATYHGKIMRVRNASEAEIREAIPYGIEEILGHWDNAKQMNACGKAANRVIPFHLKLNSAGMGRNGLDLSTPMGKNAAIDILKMPWLKPVGLMTHFPKECPVDLQASLQQFQRDCDWIMNAAGLDRRALLIHAANSYALFTDPQTHLDMVRPGSLLYGDGLPEIFTHGFCPVMVFKTRIVSINDYRAGQTVSYERECTLKRDSRIASVLVGYANGYRRAFSHQGRMLINGQFAPVIGRVSMNVTTLDVTDIVEAKIGDEVVVFGEQGDLQITQAEIETMNQALFADVYTIWGQCNPKVLL
ncbi:alanine racemase [Ostreibacterium oceani]|uniref:Alanine racemase n=1 Tax=Ostreibacterium oceani TaxID=2654998 RepID=A0A6N7F417_9GAMM|nr:alanine racemase [Ostreibacterium oceani]MPV86626.1 alanine racemase [Ostreibacterium oceani]